MSADRDNSYRTRVAPGQTVVLDRDVVGVRYDHSIADFHIVDRPVAPAGSVVTVISEYNAGFEGIKFSFELDGRHHWHNVTTAAIR